MKVFLINWKCLFLNTCFIVHENNKLMPVVLGFFFFLDQNLNIVTSCRNPKICIALGLEIDIEVICF